MWKQDLRNLPAVLKPIALLQINSVFSILFFSGIEFSSQNFIFDSLFIPTMKKSLSIFLIIAIPFLACNIPVKPDLIGTFNNGLAPAKYLGKWGIVDSLMNPVVPFEYDSIMPTSDGMTAVCKDYHWGYLGPDLKILIPEKYTKAYPFANGCALVSEDFDSPYYLINKKDQKISGPLKNPAANNSFFTFQKASDTIENEDFGILYRASLHAPLDQWYKSIYFTGLDTAIIAGNGEVYIIITAHQKDTKVSFEDFFFTNLPDVIKIRKGKVWSLLQLDGTRIPGEFSEIGTPVKDTSLIYHKAGIFDIVTGLATLGALPMYQITHPAEEIETNYIYFADDLVQVRNKNMTGYIDRKGKVIIPLMYSDGKEFHGNTAAVKKNGMWGLIDKSNKERLPFRFQSLTSAGASLVLATENGKYTVYNCEGKKVLEESYTRAKILSSGGLMLGNGKNFDYRDSTATKHCGPVIEEFEDFSDGLALIKSGGHYGYLSKDAKIRIPAIYDEACSFKDGQATVKKDGKYIKIDTRGKQIE
jgi:hypothetical protein